jgi:hypothetical protein
VAKTYLETLERLKPIDEFRASIAETGQARLNPEYTKVADAILEERSEVIASHINRGHYSSAVGEAIGGLTEAFKEDPRAAVAMLAESLPAMLALAAKPLAIATYGASFIDTKQRGLEAFQKEHGRLPDQSEANTIEAFAAINVGADLLGNVIQVKLTPLLNKLLPTIPDTIPADMVQETVKRFPKLQQVGKEVGRLAAIPATEFAQGGVQEFTEQQMGKQDISKTNIQEVAEGALKEAFAVTPMAGLAAVTSPKEVIQAGKSNEVVRKATEASQAFQSTQTYQSLPEASKGPTEAYRAFEKVVATEGTTPEQKQEAFNQALSSLVNVPQSNTERVAKALKRQAEAAGITLDQDTKAYFDAVIPKETTLTQKVGATLQETKDKIVNRG